jgi:hypothetical protein
MAVTDDPLKLLVESCIEDFAAWLLQAEVVEAHPLNVELPGQPQRVDQLFRLALSGHPPLADAGAGVDGAGETGIAPACRPDCHR